MTGVHRIRLRTLASLLAGRGAYRLAQMAATVTLLPLWGTARYGTFAGAVAAFYWVIALLLTGPEKTVLKLLPRAPRTGPLILRAVLALLWVVPVPVIVAFAALVAAGNRGPVAIYLGVAAMATTSGALLLLVGLLRAVGRPWYDSRTFFILTVVQVGMLGLAALGLGPLGYIGCMVAIQAFLCVVLLVRLGRPSLRIRSRPGFVRRMLWTVVLIGSPEVCLYMCISVLVALLSASAFRDQVGELFAVEVVWSAGVNLLLYVLRVYTPQMSVRLVGASGAAGRRSARRIVGWVILGDLAYVAAIVTALTTTDLLAASRGGHALLVWAALFGGRTPMLVFLIFANYLVENSDARSTRITGVAALAGLVAATVAGLVAVPLIGGVGVLMSFAVAGIVQAAVLWGRLGRSTESARVWAGGKGQIMMSEPAPARAINRSA